MKSISSRIYRKREINKLEKKKGMENRMDGGIQRRRRGRKIRERWGENYNAKQEN
jgi:hypothetical protein